MTTREVIKANISDLTPDPRNANKGTQRGRGMLDKSLRQYGAGRSILLDRHNRIIAGNKTTEATADIGLNDVMIVESDGTQLVAVKRTDLDLDDSAARELAYADNRVAQVDLDWDATQMLQDAAAGIDLDKFFMKDELVEMLGRAIAGDADAEPQIDRAAELNEKWQVKRGDLWRIGAHRLYCGDCEATSTIERVKAWNAVDLFHADPPYGIDLLSGKSGNLGKSKIYKPVENDDAAFDPRPFLGVGKTSILWGANHYADKLPPSSFWLVWDKQGGAKDTTFATCELAWCSADMPARIITHIWDGFRRDSEKGEDRYHPNQKPVAVVEWAIKWIDSKAVADFYSGTGPCMIACQHLVRQCFSVEKDEAYCAVILERMATAFPGIEIERIG